MATTKRTVEVQLSYVVPGASWRPEYDLFYEPAKGQKIGPGKVELMVLRQGLAVTLAGAVVGLLASLALARVLGSLLFGVSARDPMIFAAVPVVLAVVAVLATLVPARRAAAVEPGRALRE